MSASADIQTRTHANVLSVPINAVAVREKNSNTAVSANTDDASGDENSNKNDTRAQNPNADELDEVVFVLQPSDTVRKVKVRTDIQDINYIEIVDGLKAGDQIVTGPYSIVSKTLKSGQHVKVVPKDKLFEEKKN